MCHENKMGAAKEQHPYINQVDIVGGTGWNRGWNRVEQWNSSGTSGTVTRPLFSFLTKQYGQILLTAMESYPFFI